MRRFFVAVLLLALGATGALAVWMRTLDHDPSVWHVDPAMVSRTGRPNDYLVAPAGMTASEPDRLFEPRPIPARDLLFLFESIAMNAPRTHHVAMDEAALTITYVQTSLIFGFPDYITVRAVEAPEGAGLIVWSRSRFGHSDFGVNRDRVQDWLGALGD